jgi:hypothetical protein
MFGVDVESHFSGKGVAASSKSDGLRGQYFAENIF